MAVIVAQYCESKSSHGTAQLKMVMIKNSVIYFYHSKKIFQKKEASVSQSSLTTNRVLTYFL